MLSNTKYNFWWTPKPLNNRRNTRQYVTQKSTPTEPYRNVMFDKRVVRGSNYGATSIELETFNKAAEWRRRNILRKKILMRNQRNVIGTPPPVMGRRHEVIQTDKYLEDLLEHPPVRTTDTQTELFLEFPPSFEFIASKIGVDVSTAIEPGDLPLQETVVSDNEEDIPLIERFIEACILDIEVELESEISFCDSTSAGANNRTAPIPPDVDKVETAQIVDSQEILTAIIEEIVKQRNSACAELESERGAAADADTNDD